MAESFIESDATPATEASVGLKAPTTATAPAEIKVSELNKSAAPATPAKKGSVKESIFAELNKRFGEPAAAAPAAKTEEDEVETEEQPLSEPTVPEGKTPAKEGGKTEPEAKKKLSPWKVVEAEKAKVKALEVKLLEYESKGVAPEKIKEYEDKVAAAEKRAKELDEHIKYVDYTKSSEFQEKYQKPYEDQWKRSMVDLSEITANSGTEAERPIEAKDILELVNLPLKEAKLVADEKFGDFAQEVMAHRKEIRKLFEEQSMAIEKAKKDGAEITKTRTEAQTKEFKELSESLKKTWDESNQAAIADEKYGTYFKPVEGDQEGNQRLSKGFELADRAFGENPMAPGLTADQRREIVKRHAAVRNRCAAFGRLAWQNSNFQKRITELETELKGYKETEPERSGSAAAPAKGGTGKTSAKSRLFAELEKIAK